MKLSILIFYSLLIFNFGYSQGINVFVRVNKAHFSMSEDLQNIQKDIISNYSSLNFKITDNFPATFNYQILINLDRIWKFDNNLTTGILFDIASTAGRIHYSDYSGEFENIQKITRWQIGIHLEKDMAPKSIISIVPTVQISYLKTKLEAKYLLELSNFNEFQNENKYQNSIAVEPGINLQIKIYNFLFRIFSGYQFDLIGSKMFEIQSINSNYLFKSNWSGFRYGLLMGYKIM